MLSTTASISSLSITLAVLSGAAEADVTPYLSELSRVGGVTNSAQFEGLEIEDSLSGYNEDGLMVDVSSTAFLWNAPGLDGSGAYYANTGTRSLIDIALMSGEDFDVMGLQFSTGWDANNLTTVFLWVQIWDDGQLIEEMNIDGVSGQYLTLDGGGFDLVRIGSYESEAKRDERNEFNKNAIVIDNVQAGTELLPPIPAPSALSILGIGALAAGRRRRA